MNKKFPKKLNSPQKPILAKQSKNNAQFLKGSSPGLSIMLAVVLIAIIVIFSAGVTTVVTDAARQSSNVKQGTTAYYAAEQGVEQALWLNQTLAASDQAIGANIPLSKMPIDVGDCQSFGGCAKTNFKIAGTTQGLLEQTVNDQYIVPFPWTGNVPWHGEGSNPDGGCNPQKPPIRSGKNPNKEFTYSYNDGTATKTALASEIDHPCNWGLLKPGQRVSIPLFSLNNGTETKFNDFTLKLRTPCLNGNEMCPIIDNNEYRYELNCFDKGTGERLCSIFNTLNNKFKGEVLALWQINGRDISNYQKSLTPLENASNATFYNSVDSQLYEGKLNAKIKDGTFAVLKTDGSAAFPQDINGVPKGKLISGNIPSMDIRDFITSVSKPTLSLSLVANLIGCDGASITPPTSCLINHKSLKIPYLEYQVILNNGSAASPPSNQENVINAEGQAGPFNQTIQIKVPNDNSNLEYVIQQ